MVGQATVEGLAARFLDGGSPPTKGKTPSVAGPSGGSNQRPYLTSIPKRPLLTMGKIHSSGLLGISVPYENQLDLPRSEVGHH